MWCSPAWLTSQDPGIAGDINVFDALCRALVHHSGAHVVSVGYSLAPEHKFPEGLQDAYAATCWASDHSADFGADPSRITVAGEPHLMFQNVLARRLHYAASLPYDSLQRLLTCSMW